MKFSKLSDFKKLIQNNPLVQDKNHNNLKKNNDQGKWVRFSLPIKMNLKNNFSNEKNILEIWWNSFIPKLTINIRKFNYKF